MAWLHASLDDGADGFGADFYGLEILSFDVLPGDFGDPFDGFVPVSVDLELAVVECLD